MSTVYTFDGAGVYVGSRSRPIDPLETRAAGDVVYALPGPRETLIAPPSGESMWPIWNGSAWQLVPDHRGETWFSGYGQPVTVKALGDPTSFNPPLTAIEPDPPPPTIDDVAAERERRLALGFSYDFQDARGVHQIATTTEDLRHWDKVTSLANAAIAVGAPATTINIVTETGPATITALEWQSILIANGLREQPLYTASFALQAMDPIPADYATNEAYWT